MPAAAGDTGALTSSGGVRGKRLPPPAARRAAARPRPPRRLGHRVPGSVERVTPGAPCVPEAARDGLQLAGPCALATLGMTGVPGPHRYSGCGCLYVFMCAHAYRDDFAVNKLFTVRLATLQCVELHGTVLYYHPTCYTKQKTALGSVWLTTHICDYCERVSLMK